jgi:serine/threonine protein kinase
MSLPLARIGDKYEVVAKIKEGGMGEIYKVRHRLLDEVRVVKVLHPELVADSELNERFAREARAAIQLRHPNIVQIFDFTLDASGAGLIVMEYIRGTDLQQLIAQPELPSIALAIEIACQSLRALGYLHRHGFVHRDISPDNLMLSIDVEGRPLVKIIDLGIAKRRGSESQLTASGVFLGKFRYSSPEHFGAQGSGAIESRSDLYTFGLVLYELLTGHYPIRGESTSQLIAGHLFQPPRDFAETDPQGRVPEPLRRAVLKTLAKEPDGRFACAEDLIARLEKLRVDYPLSDEVLQESRSFTTSSPSRTAGLPLATSPARDEPTVVGTAGGADQDAETEVPKDPLARLVTEVEELLSSGKLIEADRMLFQARETHGPDPELSTMRDRLDALYQNSLESEVRALLSRVEAHLDEDEFSRAVEILDKARAAAPPGSPLIEEIDAAAAEVRRRSDERRSRRAVDEAERRLLVLIRRKDFTKAREMLSEAETELGAPAIKPLRKLLSRTVDDWIQGQVKQAGVAFEAERFGDAAACLEKILTVDPANGWIKNRLERARAGQRRQQEEHRRQQELDAKASALLSEAEQARDRGDLLRARLLVAGVLELKPDLDRATALAQILDHHDRAAELETSSLRTTPLSPGLMKAYTDVEGLRAAGDSVAAWRRLNEAIEELGEIDTLMKLRRQIAEEILGNEKRP